MIPRRRARAGFALIIVLGVLVLLVALVLGFLLSAATERTAASSYKASVFARELADNAVSLVQAQINVATTQGSNVSWTSQPGMVRTFDPSGALLNAYKLYSAPMMISKTVSLTSDLPPTDWANDPATWTDLNAPVQVSGVNNYPILDPGATADGYSLAANVPGATTNQPVPMPVQWLYVLQDGTTVAPTGTGTTATVAETPGNPIVGRIAFWTDDDTCKINVNTASEGTYWDVPRALTLQEQAFANYQPAQDEFQRYPGHPAMTCLSTVLYPGTTAFGAGLANSLTQAQYDNIYSIVPRIMGGGSNEGTTLAAGPITPDGDRLYANIEELLFKPNRSGNIGLTRTQLQQAKFFLTAHSRAPETNLFNLPRIACWPVDSDYDPINKPSSPYTSAFDRLIAFCSTVGDTSVAGEYYPYYFQRHDSTSPVNDMAIPRNIQLYSYLQALTSQAVPGFGGNFLSKYGADRDQILTEIYDYIRCTNLCDSNLGVGYTFTPAEGTVGHGFVAAIHYTPPNDTQPTQGFGRDYTLSSAGLGFICNADGSGNNVITVNGVPAPAPNNVPPTGARWPYSGPQPPALANPAALPDADDYKKESNQDPTSTVPSPGPNLTLAPHEVLTTTQKSIQAIFIPEFFSVMGGFTDMAPNMQIQVSGLDTLSVTTSNGTSALFPQVSDTDSASYVYTPGSAYAGWGSGGNPCWKYFGQQQGVPPRGNLPGDVLGPYIKGFYPFVGTPALIAAPAGGTMIFNGGTVTVKIYYGATTALTAANLIQTINLNFPAGIFPVPNLNTTGTPFVSVPGAATPPQTWWTYSTAGALTTNAASTATASPPGRLAYIQNFSNSGTGASAVSGNFLIDATSAPFFDILRTILPTHGDFRLVAGTNVVPAATSATPSSTTPGAAFYKHRYYDTITRAFASNFTNASNTQLDPGFDTGGKLISGITYPNYIIPDIPSNVVGDPVLSPQITGDYDDYLPHVIDGAFVNKPDEGSQPVAGQQPYFYNGHVESLPTFFSPNREMPSPGMFGSLPSGVVKGVPWQTLLFRHQPGHFGATSPEDHLLLDLFWMPVVEPYAISDRFSTDGKINMNYQILPFTYIKRDTGLQALFKSEMVAAVPNTAVTNSTYKLYSSVPTALRFRLPIDDDATLSQFDAKFAAGDVFRSASEICDLDIVPQGQSAATMPAFWAANAATAENLREKIYTTLYPRLTTKSNTYTVHFLAQSLKKVRGSAVGTWTEGRDVVTGEYRGSAVIERFINPANTSIPDYAANAASLASQPTLDTFYKWRVISNRQFAP